MIIKRKYKIFRFNFFHSYKSYVLDYSDYLSQSSPASPHGKLSSVQVPGVAQTILDSIPIILLPVLILNNPNSPQYSPQELRTIQYSY